MNGRQGNIAHNTSLAAPGNADTAIDRESIMDTIIDRLQQINSKLADTIHNQAMLSQRAFGPSPEVAGTDSKDPRPLASYAMVKINEALDFLEWQASEVLRNAHNLNKLV